MRKDQDTTNHAAQQAELDLRRFQLSVLAQATKELVGHHDPAPLADSFLLTAMGAVGAGSGFLIILDNTGHKNFLTSRGLDSGARTTLHDSLPSLTVSFNALLQDSAPHESSQLVIRTPSASCESFPQETAIALAWRTQGGRCGFLGLGERLSHVPYHAEITTFLQDLLQIFIQALDNAFAAATIRELNSELETNNESLQKALAETRSSRADLDRRVFQLRTLYDATMEFSGLKGTAEILDTLPLVILGAFGVSSCCAMLYDTATHELHMAGRGLPDTDWPADKARQLLYKGVGASFHGLTPLSTSPVPLAAFAGEPLPLPDATRALLFRLDENSTGLLLLGNKLTGGALSDEEEEVLRTLTHNAMLFLRNARAFATIQALNQDLEARNAELERTIQELTESRSRIEVLERAGARLREVLQRQLERIDRVSVRDFVFIFAVSILLGLVFNLSNPNGIEYMPRTVPETKAPRLQPDQAMDMIRDGALLVDARPQPFFEREHAAGSVSMPPSLFDFIYSMRFAALEEDPHFVIYGHTLSRLYDEEIAHRLISQGHQNVSIMQGGLEAWEEAGGHLEGE